MITFVTSELVEGIVGNPDYTIVDPRTRMRYMQGHLQGAINFPMSRLFDEHSALLNPNDLGKALGAVGVSQDRKVILYDSYDGQKASMVAWLLAYLGHEHVQIMSTFYENWVGDGREVFYKELSLPQTAFNTNIRPGMRSDSQAVQSNPKWKRLDVRTIEEFQGANNQDEISGHVPNAVNFDWREFVGINGAFLKPPKDVEVRLKEKGITKEDTIVTYCRSGSRASHSFLALRQAGYDVRLYDGSVKDWSDRGLPLERS